MNLDIEKTAGIIYKKLETWAVEFIRLLPNLVMAVVILLAFIFLGRLVKKLAFKGFNRFLDNQAIVHLLTSIVYILVVIIGLLTALSILSLDKTVTSVLAGAGVVGLALSFAFQDMATNFVSGLYISVKKPYQVGHYIKVDSYEGEVTDISMRSSSIKTPQGQIITIPNKDLFQKPVINFSKLGKRRVDIDISIPYKSDFGKAEERLKQRIKDTDFSLNDDPVNVVWKVMNADSIQGTLFFWILNPGKVSFLVARSEAIKIITDVLDDIDISPDLSTNIIEINEKSAQPLMQAMLGINNNQEEKKDDKKQP